MKTIYLAGGCFWGVQKYISQIPGVIKTSVGYANGTSEKPTYEDVCQHNAGHAETVEVIYDEKKLSLTKLLDLYVEIIDPTSLNQQGADIGPQYRTGIYHTEKSDAEIIQGWLVLLGEFLTKAVAIESAPLKNFFPAEDYHQNYLDKNPAGYCHIPSAKFKSASQSETIQVDSTEDLRQKLTPMQFEVTVCGATEPPFQNDYFDNFKDGIYVDIITGTPLFISSDKFESGCGWPAFAKPVDDTLLKTLPDNSYGRKRTEVRSAQSGAHLGHVFEDGLPELGGLRFCINSASLRFIPLKDMEKEGYGQYLPLITQAKDNL